MFRCGFCELDITPFAQSHMHGMFEERLMIDYHATPYAKAIVMENNGEKVAIVSLDSLYVYPSSYHEIVKRAAQLTGIKPENIMVTATHSHQGGITEYYDKHNDADRFYIQFVRYRAADAIAFANNRLEEANVRFGERDVFLAPRDEVRCWELMSLDGIRFEHIRPDGSKDAVTAYCKYYRK